MYFSVINHQKTSLESIESTSPQLEKNRMYTNANICTYYNIFVTRCLSFLLCNEFRKLHTDN